MTTDMGQTQSICSPISEGDHTPINACLYVGDDIYIYIYLCLLTDDAFGEQRNPMYVSFNMI